MKGAGWDAASLGTAGTDSEPGVAIRNRSPPPEYALRCGSGEIRFPHADRVPGRICGDWGNAGVAEINHMQCSMCRLEDEHSNGPPNSQV